MEKNIFTLPKSTTVIKDYSESIHFFTEVIQKDLPIFIGRIGGSDYDIIKEYYKDKSLLDDTDWYNFSVYRVKRFNGYFDFLNKKENFKKYLEDMISFYKNTDHVSYCNASLIELINTKKKYSESDQVFLNYVLENKVAFDYGFFETITPFLESFKIWGQNKKILFVSPFSKSIQHQYALKDNLYTTYKFPEFELLTYNTSITYSNAEESKESLSIDTASWHEEAEKMAKEISLLDFDIALLSCGSYAMYLGDHIKNKMGKKSIYLGGILNMYFNIYGGRYDPSGNYKNIYENSGLDLRYQIDPLELNEIEKIKSGRGKKTESLGAYFGKKDGTYSYKARK